MFKIAVVVFRESLEIALLLGVILAATRTIHKSYIYIITGCLVGVVSAAIFAFFAGSITYSFNGLGDEILDSAIILFTALMISWTVVWMQGYSKRVSQNLNELSENIIAGSASIFTLVFVVSSVILREGVEIILFVYSIASAGNVNVNDCVLGFMLGSLSGVVVGLVIYCGLIKYASKYIFQISTVMLTLIAAGLASEAAGILTSSGIIISLSDQIWDTSWLVTDDSIFGRLLNIMLGYDARPNGMQIIFYILSVSITIIMIKLRKNRFLN